MDPTKIGLLGYGTCAVAPRITALGVLPATRVSFERQTPQSLRAKL